MARPMKAEPLRIEDAPDVCDIILMSRILQLGRDYCRQLVRQGYVANIGTTQRYRIPKRAIANLLEDCANGAQVLPAPQRRGAS